MPTLQLKPSPIEVVSQEIIGIHLDSTYSKEDPSQFGQSRLSVDRDVHAVQGQEGCWVLQLTIHIDSTESGAPPAYTGRIELLGYYQVHKDYKQDPDRLIRITGASMLYGVAREMLCQITARSANGMITLPSVSFFEETPENNRVTKKTAKKKQSAKKSSSKKA